MRAGGERRRWSALNRSFYALLLRRLGVVHGVLGVGLHWLHHLVVGGRRPRRRGDRGAGRLTWADRRSIAAWRRCPNPARRLRDRRPLRLGIVGCGRLAERGLPAARWRASSLRAGRGGRSRRGAASAAVAVAAGGSPSSYASLGELLAGAGIDGLLVASPVARHVADATQAAEAGVVGARREAAGGGRAGAAALIDLSPAPYLGLQPPVRPRRARRPRRDRATSGDTRARPGHRTTGGPAGERISSPTTRCSISAPTSSTGLGGSPAARSRGDRRRRRPRARRPSSSSSKEVGRASTRPTDRPHEERIEVRIGGELVARHRIGGAVAGLRARLPSRSHPRPPGRHPSRRARRVRRRSAHGGGPVRSARRPTGVAAMAVLDAARASAAAGGGPDRRPAPSRRSTPDAGDRPVRRRQRPPARPPPRGGPPAEPGGAPRPWHLARPRRAGHPVRCRGPAHALQRPRELADHGLFYPFQWSASEQRAHDMGDLYAPPSVWEQLADGHGRTLAIDPYESRPPSRPVARHAGVRLATPRPGRAAAVGPARGGAPPAPAAVRRAPRSVDEVFGTHTVKEMLGLRRRLLGAPGRVADATAAPARRGDRTTSRGSPSAPPTSPATSSGTSPSSTPVSSTPPASTCSARRSRTSTSPSTPPSAGSWHRSPLTPTSW